MFNFKGSGEEKVFSAKTTIEIKHINEFYADDPQASRYAVVDWFLTGKVAIYSLEFILDTTSQEIMSTTYQDAFSKFQDFPLKDVRFKATKDDYRLYLL